MKKLFMTLLTVLTCGATYALPVGNPSDASLLCDGLIWEGHCGDFCDPCLSWCDAFSLRVGFYGDYVFNRHMQLDVANAPERDIEHTQLFTNAAFIAGNFWDRFDIFTTLGSTNIFIDTNNKAFGFGGTGRFQIETTSAFSWSIGARGTIWECGCTSLGAEFQYFYTKPDIKRVTLDGEASVYPGDGFDAKYWEWQFGIGISHRINVFVPYVAVKFAGSRLRFGDARFTFIEDDEVERDGELFRTENKKFCGFAVGVSLIDCEKASLTVEGRFCDEKAVYVNGQIRF